MIKLFNSTDTEFSTLGLGNLTDVISCVVTEERNGTFELELEYPIDGIHYSDIALRNIIVCKSNPFSNEQAFRIYYISKPINGIITVNAEHISYDLSGMVVSPFEADNCVNALLGLKQNAVPTCPFDFTTDKDVSARFKVSTPSSLRSLLGGTEGSILDIYGTGEYIFDNYSVSFKTHRGENRGVTIRYGKNLTDLTQEENCTKVYTAVYPYWFGTYYDENTEEDVLVTLPEKTINVEGTFNYTKVLSLDLGEYFEEPPTEEQLRNVAQAYIDVNDIGKPEVSLKVSFLQLEQAEEYEQLKLLESVYLCDTVTVIFPELGVNSTSKCIATEYDAITNKYKSLELGSARTNLANTIVNQSQEIANSPTAAFMDQEIDRATRLITGGLGGYVILNSSSGQKKPDELLILDEASGGDIKKANNVWRFNSGGFAFSNKGYNGPYEPIAITMDGKINADTVNASGIKAGTIEALLTIIAPYITDNPDKTKASFYLDAATRKIWGAAIEGSTFKQESTEGSIFIHDGWIYGQSIKGAGAALDFTGFGSETILGSKMFYSAFGTTGGEVEGAYVALAGMDKRSDRRLKKDICDIEMRKSLDFINNSKSREYKFKNKPDEVRYGFIAQEVEKNLDDCGLESNGMVIKSNEQLGLNYQDFIPHLVNYVKHLQNEIAELRKEIK